MENDKLSLSFMAAEVDLHFVVILDVDVKVDHVQLVRRLLV